MYRVRFTGERVTEASASVGDAEERGWVDPVYSLRTLWDEADDVRAYDFPTRYEALRFAEAQIGSLEDGGTDTYYVSAPHHDYSTGDEWGYAAHIETVPDPVTVLRDLDVHEWALSLDTGPEGTHSVTLDYHTEGEDSVSLRVDLEALKSALRALEGGH